MCQCCATATVSPNPDRVRFVRDGFYFWAFLLGPLWMIWNRLWLVLVLYLVAIAALFAGLTALRRCFQRRAIHRSGLLIAILIGCEGGSLRRFSLRRRWTQGGVVAATDLEESRAAVLRILGRRRSEGASSVAPVPPRSAVDPGPADLARCARAVSAARAAAMSVAIVDYGSGNLHSAAKARSSAPPARAATISRSW